MTLKCSQDISTTRTCCGWPTFSFLGSGSWGLALALVCPMLWTSSFFFTWREAGKHSVLVQNAEINQHRVTVFACARYLLGAGCFWGWSARLRFYRLRFGYSFTVCEHSKISMVTERSSIYQSQSTTNKSLTFTLNPVWGRAQIKDFKTVQTFWHRCGWNNKSSLSQSSNMNMQKIEICQMERGVPASDIRAFLTIITKHITSSYPCQRLTDRSFFWANNDTNICLV